MPIFITVSLALSFLVKTNFFYASIFSEVLFFIMGSFAITISIIGSLKKAYYQWCYDLFAVGTLLTWFAYWHFFYKNGHAIFYVIPSYLVIMTSVLLLVFVSRRENFDSESIEHIRFLVNNDRFKAWFIGGALLMSIYFYQRYTIFPALMSAFVLRYSLQRSLEPYNRD